MAIIIAIYIASIPILSHLVQALPRFGGLAACGCGLAVAYWYCGPTAQGC